MITAKPVSQKIIRVYLYGLIALLIFYGLILFNSILFAENQNSNQRLAMVSPHHFKMFNQGSSGVVQVDPILKIYDSYNILPTLIKQELDINWQGSANFLFESNKSWQDAINFYSGEEIEYGIFAQEAMTKNGIAIVYALEDRSAIEWDETGFAIFQLTVFGFGVLVFTIAVIISIKMAKQISTPFSDLANQLKSSEDKDYSPLVVNGELSLELVETLSAINTYRSKIHGAFLRERTFTRYVSHELRTPMTVIRGAISILRLQKEVNNNKQLNRIKQANMEMEQLVQTFLLLAREEEMDEITTFITEDYVTNSLIGIQPTIQANQVKFHQELQCEFSVNSHPLLFSAIIQNLVKNAVNCSVDGSVSLFISPERIDVIDNGVGLDAKPRGYEGFGIGLNIVKDICAKYHWKFTIKNNVGAGCTAAIIFS